eukprot:gi/632947347/ref/XP_007889003.1/ PREDICTED: kelch-like protein 1 [Callorhinchus milii]
MSASGRKEFDVKHILRLRWKLFNHPSPSSAGTGGCQDSFEHWGPSQNRLKNHNHERGSFWKKTNTLNGVLLPAHGRSSHLDCQQQQQRTVFYVEAVEEVPRLQFTRDSKSSVEDVKEEMVHSDCCKGTGERCLHRLVLSAVSDYFAAMFTSDVCEAKQEEIKMEGIDPKALWDLVQFAYTGCLELKEETIENLLAAACLLQLSQVVEVCCHFLMKLLHPSNCLGIRAFADAQGCIELMNVAHKYTMEHIVEVIRNQEFLLLPADDILKLLASDDLNVPEEETIFHALMMWVKYDMQKRCSDLSKLLSYIRLPLLPPQLLADLENNALFKDDLECQKLILEAMKYHLLPERRPLMQSPRTKPRKSTVGALYAVGGMDANKGATTIEKYDLRTNTWAQAGVMNGRRLQFGVAVIDDKLYVVGGRDGLKTLNTVECYDSKTKTWTALPPMSTHRHGLGVAVLEGPMYAVGGHDGWSYLNTVERWDPQSRQWTYVASMSTARSTVGVAALNGKLYAVGGRDGSACLKSIECYDPHTNKWSLCTPMSKRRGGVGVATCDGFLYAVGGHDAPASNHCSRLSDCVERYDPKTDTWTTVASLSVPRDAVGVCLLGDGLYAVGGYDGQTYLNTMESYDPQTNEWIQAASLNIGRAGACVIVVKQL